MILRMLIFAWLAQVGYLHRRVDLQILGSPDFKETSLSLGWVELLIAIVRCGCHTGGVLLGRASVGVLNSTSMVDR